MIDDISPPGSWVRELSARPHTYRDVWAALREAEARLAKVEAERDALRAAVERYKWLRDEWWLKGNNFTWPDEPTYGHQFDEAVDEARGGA